eukprot:CAMPEP_0202856648 /NCGR_PEP_ID=MMETSP1389-20130828/92153_1 /ASSEMBLY_ACC=CAM_ASM_000865 /TAXON_ID=302021 /ORGANISM="Rhodomonas sp., Strain CCMP768" /LENGTH=64 /DNA_ID=CAMNT_0049535325 /DNA_START=977 /DNA_END=1168 /DNA_ORIENTATION=+
MTRMMPVSGAPRLRATPGCTRVTVIMMALTGISDHDDDTVISTEYGRAKCPRPDSRAGLGCVCV